MSLSRWLLIVAIVGGVGSFLYAIYHIVRLQTRLRDAYMAGKIHRPVSAALLLPDLPGDCVGHQRRALVAIVVFFMCWIGLLVALFH